MLSVEKVVEKDKMSDMISTMMDEGYSFIRAKKYNEDGTVILEFKEKSKDKRQMITDQF